MIVMSCSLSLGKAISMSLDMSRLECLSWTKNRRNRRIAMLPCDLILVPRSWIVLTQGLRCGQVPWGKKSNKPWKRSEFAEDVSRKRSQNTKRNISYDSCCVNIKLGVQKRLSCPCYPWRLWQGSQKWLLWIYLLSSPAPKKVTSNYSYI